jgi:hypothetical protein
MMKLLLATVMLIPQFLYNPALAADKKVKKAPEAQQAPNGPLCFPIAQATAGLAKEYGEHLAGLGKVNSGNGVVLMLNPETGTWTLLRVTQDGAACPLLAGEHWRAAKHSTDDEGNPS